MLGSEQSRYNYRDSLLLYRSASQLADRLRDDKLAVQRKFISPVLTFTNKSLQQIANSRGGIVTQSKLTEFVNAVSDEYKNAANNSPGDKIGRANKIISMWSKLYDKSIRDQQIPLSYLNDINTRIKGLTTSFLSGSPTVISTSISKDQEKELSEQVKKILKLMDQLTEAKKTAINITLQLNISDTINYLTKTYTTLVQTNAPFTKAAFEVATSKANNILDEVENEKEKKTAIKDVENKDDKLEHNYQTLFKQIDAINGIFVQNRSRYEALNQAGIKNDEIDNKLGELDEVYKNLNAQLGGPNSSTKLDEANHLTIMFNKLNNEFTKLLDMKEKYSRIEPTEPLLATEELHLDLKRLFQKAYGGLPIPGPADFFDRLILPRLDLQTQDEWENQTAKTKSTLGALLIRYINQGSTVNDLKKSTAATALTPLGKKTIDQYIHFLESPKAEAAVASGRHKIVRKVGRKKRVGGLGFMTANNITSTFIGPKDPNPDDAPYNQIRSVSPIKKGGKIASKHFTTIVF